MSTKIVFVVVIVASLAVFVFGSLQAEEAAMPALAQKTVQEIDPVKEAIVQAGMLATSTEKVSFLLQQATSFYKSEKFQETVDLAKYVLQYLDADSLEAKDLLAVAKEKLAQIAMDKMGGITQAMDSMTMGISSKMDDFGK